MNSFTGSVLANGIGGVMCGRDVNDIPTYLSEEKILLNQDLLSILLDILKSKASQSIRESKEDPQQLIKGSVIQVRGTIFRFTHIFIKACNNIQQDIHKAAYLAKRSVDFDAI